MTLVTAVSVDVTVNGQDYEVNSTYPSTAMNNTFYYVNMSITSLSPIEGPATGGTVVNVTGSGFINTVTIYCQFGTSDNITLDTVTATVLSSTLLQCTSPALQSFTSIRRLVSLQISVNGIDYTNLSTSITGFTYEPNVTVLSVFPSMGEWTGGSVTLVYRSQLPQYQSAGMYL